MLPKLILFGICMIPVAILLPRLYLGRRKARLHSRSPFTDRLLRPAGESLRLRIQQQTERLDEFLVNALLYPIVLGGVLVLTLPRQEQVLPFLIGAVPVVGLTIGATYFLWGRKIPGMIKELRDYELGFQGERYVGEELNQLLKIGFRVFHDLEFEGFNIDHVLVGPPGVFAVETKTRRKPIGEKGKAAHKVTFDGRQLHYPWGTDTHGLKQAQLNAEHLSSWLTSATADRVIAKAILALPGWWVERKGGGAVHVVNPKEIPQIFRGTQSTPLLSPNQIQRIVHQIEQKCRNLEV